MPVATERLLLWPSTRCHRSQKGRNSWTSALACSVPLGFEYRASLPPTSSPLLGRPDSSHVARSAGAPSFENRYCICYGPHTGTHVEVCTIFQSSNRSRGCLDVYMAFDVHSGLPKHPMPQQSFCCHRRETQCFSVILFSTPRCARIPFDRTTP